MKCTNHGWWKLVYPDETYGGYLPKTPLILFFGTRSMEGWTYPFTKMNNMSTPMSVEREWSLQATPPSFLMIRKKNKKTKQSISHSATPVTKITINRSILLSCSALDQNVNDWLITIPVSIAWMNVLMTLGPRKYAGCASRSESERGMFASEARGAGDPRVPGDEEVW